MASSFTSKLLTAMTLAVSIPMFAACNASEDPEVSDLVGVDEALGDTADALSGSRPTGSSLRTTANLNLRSGASTSRSVLLTIPKGATVTVVSSTPSNGFYNVKYGSRSGWAHGGYLVVPNSGSGGGGNVGNVSVKNGPVVAHAQRFANQACARFRCPYEVMTRNGHSPTRTRALDLMMSRINTKAAGSEKTRGDNLAAYAISNDSTFKVDYAIWRQRINSADGRGWRAMGNRGSNTANHFDHVHVSFNP